MPSAGQRIRIAQALLICVCAGLFGVVGRLVYIQERLGPELLAWSQRRQITTVPIPGRRGSILDRNHRVLAGSHDEAVIFADPRLVEDHGQAAAALHALLGDPEAELRKLLDNPTSPGFVVLRRGVSQEQVEALNRARREGTLSGVQVTWESARDYPMGAVAAHAVGFVGKDRKGLEGVELSCESFLKPTDGSRRVYRDVHRRAVLEEADSYVAPKDGAHVVLTLDTAIQEVVEREVAAAVEKYRAECGMGLVMDPRTGEVLAMTVQPTYDPSNPGAAPAENRRNRILTDPVEPGSVFKPFVMMPALAEGVIKPSDVFNCYNGLYMTCGRALSDHHPYGNLTVEEIMIHSSNIGMAQIGERLGNERVYAALKRFGLARVTGIDLPGESDGMLLPPRLWDKCTITRLPMGHGAVAVTPIQLLSAFNSIMNGGRLVQPRLVQMVVNGGGEIIEDRREVVDRGQSIDPASAAIMRDILARVVNEGTGKPCKLSNWQVMGKTGTAEVPWSAEARRQRRVKGYEPDAYLGSFIAGAPAREPRVTALVMIRKPRKSIGYYGGTVAAPAVKVILEQTLSYLGVPYDPPSDAHPTLMTDARD